jgi:hypothetical protein
LTENITPPKTLSAELAFRLTETAYGDGSLEQEDLVR